MLTHMSTLHDLDLHIDFVIFSPSELVRSHMLKEARTWNQKLAHSALDSPLVSLASILGLRDEHDAILP